MSPIAQQLYQVPLTQSAAGLFAKSFETLQLRKGLTLPQGTDCARLICCRNVLLLKSNENNISIWTYSKADVGCWHL